MKTKNEPRKRKELLRSYLLFTAVLAVVVTLLLIFPGRRQTAVETSLDYLLEMIMILPGVMVLMGLFAVFISKEQVVAWLGKSSGIRGLFIALVLGSLPTGPLYVAFPLAAILLKKGARVSNIIVFLSAWACIKIPQELVELQFLGLEFMALRLGLTIVFVFIMGIAMEKIMERTEQTNGGDDNEGI
jgi:uncharacterized membrane protein YraQ (UPF0718 family)